MVLPTSFEHALEGQVYTQELEAKEFVRVFIDDDVFTEELPFEFDEASGSRCSDKIMAHPKKSATQHRKYSPRSSSGRFAMDCSFRRVSFLSSSLVFA